MPRATHILTMPLSFLPQPPTHQRKERKELSCLALHVPQENITLDLLDIHHLHKQLIHHFTQEDNLEKERGREGGEERERGREKGVHYFDLIPVSPANSHPHPASFVHAYSHDTLPSIFDCLTSAVSQ